jgi:phosphoribosyl 1,2-cyclic phosphodiesterase
MMNIKVWGARGSIPAPGPETMRYGGNTSCVELTLSDGSTLILDAGTGIRNLGLALPRTEQPVNILLTHLHLDHIQGLMFFAPLFRPESEIVIWGPASPEASLVDRVARYISAPLAPVEVRELPSHVSFREAEPLEWTIGPARVRAQAVNHRGLTLGYRIDDADSSLCYIPDHEPGLGAPLSELDDDWISGFELARGASMLIHDCQYTDTEYPQYIGWGHCPVSDALGFAHRVGAKRVLLFHHDPLHSDEFLDGFSGEIASLWHGLGGRAGEVELAAERHEIAVAHPEARTLRVSASG